MQNVADILQGTMSGTSLQGTADPAAPTVPTPAAPQPAPQTAAQTGPVPQNAPVFAPPSPGQSGAVTPDQSQQSNQFGLSQAMMSLQSNVTSNNTLMSQRNLLLKSLYDQPLTDAEKSQLDPTLLQAVNSGDRSQIDMSLRLISDQVSGRTSTLDQSVQYLTTAYNDQQKQLETNRTDAISNVQNFVTQYGSNAGAALQALYGPNYVKQLASMGIDLQSFEKQNSPTINQQRYASQYGFAIGSNGDTYNLNSYDPSNPQYGSTISGIASGIGNVSNAADATSYIQQIAPNSPITGDMVMNAAQQYGVDPATIMGVMQQESSFLTNPNAVTDTADNNPGSIMGGAGGHQTNYPTLQDGVNGIAQWLSNHKQAGAASSSSGTSAQFPNWISSGNANVDTVAQGISAGTIPPPTVSSRPTQYMIQLEAALQKNGVNLLQLSQEYTATQTYIKTSNTPQQVRLKQAISSVQQGVTKLKSDADAWNAGGFAPFNAANLAAASIGAYGQAAQQLAVDFTQQSTIIQDELGQTFMGGNSPTDKALGLAGQVLSTNWSAQTFDGAVQQLQENLGFRLNAIDSVQVGGLGGAANPYAPGASQSGASGTDYTSQLDSILQGQ
jgi:hypothetical protein